MVGFVEKLFGFALKTVVFAYLAIALLNGIEKHRHNGTRDLGPVIATIEGAGWPIATINDAMRKQ